MGTGYKGGANHHYSFSDNVSNLKSNYNFSNGYFGEKGQGRLFTRNITSHNPIATSKDFFDKAAYGGVIARMSNGKGQTVKMKDGTIISYRKVSSSDGSPAVDINISKSKDFGDVKTQKIHFIKE